MSLIRSSAESASYVINKNPKGSGLYHYSLYPEQSLYDLQVSSNLYQLISNSNNSPPIIDNNNNFYNNSITMKNQLMANSNNSPPMIIDNNNYNNSYNNSITSSNISNPSPQSNSNFEIQMDFDQEEIHLKLQELEHALLDDDSDLNLMEDPFQDLGFLDEQNWDKCINNNNEINENILSPNSPKNSSSSESSLISNSNCNEARTLKQLLFDCANLISQGDINNAQNIINELRKQVSIQGDPLTRLSAYLTEGLAAKIEYSGSGIYKALKCKEPPGSYQLSAMQILFEICPCFRFGFMSANFAIIEACKGEQKIHIIDFDINQGTQYINLIQYLATQENKIKKIRITGIDSPESVQRQIGGLKIIGQRLEKLAEDCKINLEFVAIGGEISEIGVEDLNLKKGEGLIVNFAFMLHHMHDESVSVNNERDKLLRMVKGLNPKLVTVVEQDVNTNTAPFYPRFVEVYNYYSAIFESLDATLPRESADRMNVERQCLAREIVNIIACEGPDRIERYEAAGKWKARMKMAGFESCAFNANVSINIRTLLNSYCNRYRFEEEFGSLHFGWENKILVVASAWR